MPNDRAQKKPAGYSQRAFGAPLRYLIGDLDHHLAPRFEPLLFLVQHPVNVGNQLHESFRVLLGCCLRAQLLPFFQIAVFHYVLWNRQASTYLLRIKLRQVALTVCSAQNNSSKKVEREPGRERARPARCSEQRGRQWESPLEWSQWAAWGMGILHHQDYFPLDNSGLFSLDNSWRLRDKRSWMGRLRSRRQ